MTSRESNDDTAFDSCFCLQIYKLFSIRLHFRYKKLESSLLAELSKLSVNDFARLATLSSIKPDHDAEDKDVESFMRRLASPHSGLSD